MEHRYYKLNFQGSGLELFRIKLVNLILTMLTLGLYYPWAKAKTLDYLYNQTYFEDSPFSFTGTGKEMFKGFIKAMLILLVFYAALIISMRFGEDHPGWFLTGVLCFYLLFIVMMPFILHGSYRYRMAKSNWRGIRFGYVGERKVLVGIFLKGFFLTLITFGIYGAWFQVNLRRYMLSNVRIGNANFVYDADGMDFFLLNIKGYFLTIFTLGIYWFWWQRDLYRFFVNNLRLEQGENKALFFNSRAEAVDFFELIVLNTLIVFLTLGLGTPWATTRTLNFVTRNMLINGYVAFDELEQAQEAYSDATGEEFSDLLDFGFII
ncbi:YjgN family protein [Flavihumibacter petaseus]|uniref:DUF898 domain-containing protein n=1 Tax=Flavihumibacter petaseus NBRC 106054 TaxID=1220578 RepID=A0A0E9N142_9BACT|nr:DUF898 family protein [Flavihumibacter petaseus]GAO43458.1 hypothetical protein FPE01S_02_05630 [Flavihumibacter petaseus NBRC 106054]